MVRNVPVPGCSPEVTLCSFQDAKTLWLLLHSGPVLRGNVAQVDDKIWVHRVTRRMDCPQLPVILIVSNCVRYFPTADFCAPEVQCMLRQMTLYFQSLKLITDSNEAVTYHWHFLDTTFYHTDIVKMSWHCAFSKCHDTVILLILSWHCSFILLMSWHCSFPLTSKFMTQQFNTDIFLVLQLTTDIVMTLQLTTDIVKMSWYCVLLLTLTDYHNTAA